MTKTITAVILIIAGLGLAGDSMWVAHRFGIKFLQPEWWLLAVIVAISGVMFGFGVGVIT